jgi:uncharacterized protein YukE
VEIQPVEDQRGARDAATALADALCRIGSQITLPGETGARVAEGELDAALDALGGGLGNAGIGWIGGAAGQFHVQRARRQMLGLGLCAQAIDAMLHRIGQQFADAGQRLFRVLGQRGQQAGDRGASAMVRRWKSMRWMLAKPA